MSNTTCLNQTWYYDWQAELNAGASIIIIFFLTTKCHCFSHQHSWLKRSSNQPMYTTEMIRDETQSVGGSITCFWSSHLIIIVERPVTLIWFCFSRNLSWLCQSDIFHNWSQQKKKMSWHSDWPNDGRKNVMKHVLVTPTVLSITSDYLNWVRDAVMDFVSVRFFFMTLTVTFCSTASLFYLLLLLHSAHKQLWLHSRGGRVVSRVPCFIHPAQPANPVQKRLLCCFASHHLLGVVVVAH